MATLLRRYRNGGQQKNARWSERVAGDGTGRLFSTTFLAVHILFRMYLLLAAFFSALYVLFVFGGPFATFTMAWCEGSGPYIIHDRNDFGRGIKGKKTEWDMTTATITDRGWAKREKAYEQGAQKKQKLSERRRKKSKNQQVVGPLFNQMPSLHVPISAAAHTRVVFESRIDCFYFQFSFR